MGHSYLRLLRRVSNVQKERYDCWPVVAMLAKLPSSDLFLLRNTVPLEVIK